MNKYLVPCVTSGTLHLPYLGPIMEPFQIRKWSKLQKLAKKQNK